MSIEVNNALKLVSQQAQRCVWLRGYRGTLLSLMRISSPLQDHLNSTFAHQNHLPFLGPP